LRETFKIISKPNVTQIPKYIQPNYFVHKYKSFQPNYPSYFIPKS